MSSPFLQTKKLKGGLIVQVQTASSGAKLRVKHSGFRLCSLPLCCPASPSDLEIRYLFSVWTEELILPLFCFYSMIRWYSRPDDEAIVSHGQHGVNGEPQGNKPSAFTHCPSTQLRHLPLLNLCLHNLSAWGQQCICSSLTDISLCPTPFAEHFSPHCCRQWEKIPVESWVSKRWVLQANSSQGY